MQLASRSTVSHDRGVRSADAVLGEGHPLSRASRRLRVVREQALVVAAVLVSALGAVLMGASDALPLVVAAVAVEIVLACAGATLADIRRERVLDLIIDGLGELPIDIVARERGRLLSRQRQDALARRVDEVRDRARQPIHAGPSGRPLFSPRVVRAVDRELMEIAALLRRDDPGVRGLAKLERLLGHAWSALYGEDAEELREELHRVRFLLLN